jgi:hypothetical protein
MKSYEVMRTFRRQAGAKVVAAAVGLTKNHTDKWCRPVGGLETGELNPLDRLAQLAALPGGRALVDWLCGRAGGFFVRNPAPQTLRSATGRSQQARAQALLAAHSQAEAQLAQFKLDVARAVQDGQVTATEAAQLRSDWEVAKSELESFVVACERGSFRLGALFFPLLPWLAEAELVA